MSTTLHSPEDLDDFAYRLRGLPTVTAVTVRERDPGLKRPTLEVLVGPGFDRIPPSIIRLLGEADLDVREVETRGGFFSVVAC